MKKPRSKKRTADSKEQNRTQDLGAGIDRAIQSWVVEGLRPSQATRRGKGSSMARRAMGRVPEPALSARAILWRAEAAKDLQSVAGLKSWELGLVTQGKGSFFSFSRDSGPLWVVKLNGLKESGQSSLYGLYRDAMGPLVAQALSTQVSQLEVELMGAEKEEALGALVGLDVAAYSYLRVQRQSFPLAIQLNILSQGKAISPEWVKEASCLSRGVNLSRHLVNLPPNRLHPQSFAQEVKRLFKSQRDVKVEVWDVERLRQEQMGLFVAVGESAPHPPCLVRVKYRPSGLGKKAPRPLAFVGKGITFDSGGLNLKPGSNMRLMKKDMGGAASVMGLAYWACLSGLKRPMDFYLALAENSVDQKAFRPSDILKSRSGLEVEIHNTDAEGRLVLADTLDVAVTQKGADEPSIVIDVATLTGAIKAGLGVDLAGLFSNREDLSQALLESSRRMADLGWPMPLHQKYRPSMKSTVADMTNAVDGFGGAITAALFLESFVKSKPWAHLDIYAWKDSAEGAYTEAGASGQAVQWLADFCTSYRD